MEFQAMGSSPKEGDLREDRGDQKLKLEAKKKKKKDCGQELKETKATVIHYVKCIS